MEDLEIFKQAIPQLFNRTDSSVTEDRGGEVNTRSKEVGQMKRGQYPFPSTAVRRILCISMAGEELLAVLPTLLRNLSLSVYLPRKLAPHDG